MVLLLMLVVEVCTASVKVEIPPLMLVALFPLTVELFKVVTALDVDVCVVVSMPP